MTFHEIRDHDHDLETVRERHRPDLGGRTVVVECRSPDCEYRRTSWRETTTLDDFGADVDEVVES